MVAMPREGPIFHPLRMFSKYFLKKTLWEMSLVGFGGIVYENFVLILLRGDNLGGVVMWRYITP